MSGLGFLLGCLPHSWIGATCSLVWNLLADVWTCRLLDERRELPSKIAALSSEGKRLVEAVSNVKGAGQRLLDAKLQEVGEQLGRLEARLREVEHRLSLLDGCELEAEWVSRCLADFNRVWDTLSSENRGRLIRAVIERVEVDEPKGDVRTFIANLGAATEVIASAAGASS